MYRALILTAMAVASASPVSLNRRSTPAGWGSCDSGYRGYNAIVDPQFQASDPTTDTNPYWTFLPGPGVTLDLHSITGHYNRYDGLYDQPGIPSDAPLRMGRLKFDKTSIPSSGTFTMTAVQTLCLRPWAGYYTYLTIGGLLDDLPRNARASIAITNAEGTQQVDFVQQEGQGDRYHTAFCRPGSQSSANNVTCERGDGGDRYNMLTEDGKWLGTHQLWAYARYLPQGSPLMNYSFTIDYTPEDIDHIPDIVFGTPLLSLGY